MWQGAAQAAPTSFTCTIICILMLNIVNRIQLSYYSSLDHSGNIFARFPSCGGVFCCLFSRHSPLCLREKPSKTTRHKNRNQTKPNDRFGFKKRAKVVLFDLRAKQAATFYGKPPPLPHPNSLACLRKLGRRGGMDEGGRGRGGRVTAVRGAVVRGPRARLRIPPRSRTFASRAANPLTGQSGIQSVIQLINQSFS